MCVFAFTIIVILSTKSCSNDMSVPLCYCKTCIFRAHLLFANGQPKFSQACIFLEWAKSCEDRRQKIPGNTKKDQA